ncbi:hypothetical protein KEC16_05500 [Magnetospirillum sp. J10]|uniref:Uncharacterized protein n=1 Tax=Magnetospirillum sulfuroxidans TaxID=611300 RepID=A0ABS5I9T1_9PROT|nr:hypothetical protein [Magnetospirillum sulfuroxidans]MBR9971165.1 hypothetical protein [Magnetospirillum sulfuroxidans]
MSKSLGTSYYRDALREARVDREVALALGGWAGDGGNDETADNYGCGVKATTLFAAISEIGYDLDLMHLYRADYEP